ncbi:hypothetical protein [uncultured Roseibium sp.]|uniref:hypothetical protein n=1 Tax=uncultured Roseibium sp. TaxID=1936171 RepID=UPI0026185D4D|nr:hypothetical protein [uncultured Roseibium sp.]
MSRVQNQSKRRVASQKHELSDARPLLQAILLGIVLATALIAAAAMANPDDRTDGQGGNNPEQELGQIHQTSVSYPARSE